MARRELRTTVETARKRVTETRDDLTPGATDGPARDCRAMRNRYDGIVPGGGAAGEWLQQATLAIRARVPLGEIAKPRPVAA